MSELRNFATISNCQIYFTDDMESEVLSPPSVINAAITLEGIPFQFHIHWEGYVTTNAIETQVSDIGSTAYRKITPELFYTAYEQASKFAVCFYSEMMALQGYILRSDLDTFITKQSISDLHSISDTICYCLEHTHSDDPYFGELADLLGSIGVFLYESTTEPPKPGYIYILQAIAPDNYYKIGLSKAPVDRIKSLDVKLPFPIKPLHIFPTNHRFKAERQLHERYADKRVNGEWFQLTGQDVQDICAIERMDIEGVRV